MTLGGGVVDDASMTPPPTETTSRAPTTGLTNTGAMPPESTAGLCGRKSDRSRCRACCLVRRHPYETGYVDGVRRRSGVKAARTAVHLRRLKSVPPCRSKIRPREVRWAVPATGGGWNCRVGRRSAALGELAEGLGGGGAAVVGPSRGSAALTRARQRGWAHATGLVGTPE